jgi:DNA-directed RNA polymerase subunit RPC12/RpoP
MALKLRHLLVWLVAAAWVAGTWRFALGGPGLRDLGSALTDQSLAGRWSEFHIAGWFAAMLATMFAVDRLYCRFLASRWGVDPMKVHWSRLRNRKGDFFCAACRSIFMLPPEDLSDQGWVRCGDCGHAVSPYGEMKPFLPLRSKEGFARYARRLLWHD